MEHKRDCCYRRRKQSSRLEDCPRRHLRENILELLSCENPKCVNMQEETPKPISFLSEAHRRHLMDVLEYLESMNIAYELDEKLIDATLEFAQTIFEVRHSLLKPRATLAQGGRYEGLSRLSRTRGVIEAASIKVAINGQTTTHKKHQLRRPKILFIQVGPDARRRGLSVLESLRRAKISVLQTLGNESLSGQIAQAEEYHIPYTVIIGHREALEGNVIVRDTLTRSQETIPMETLGRYLKYEAKML